MFYVAFFLFFVIYLVGGAFFFLFFFGQSYLFDFYLFSFNGVDFSFSFVFDFLSVGFFSCIAIISGLVFLYSIYYMEGGINNRRFFSMVFLFVLSMFFLVFSGNFILTLLGWDGLGVVSFCLVSFYHNSSSLESGLITFVSNRIGDGFFLLSFFFFFGSGSLGWDSFSFDSSSLFLILIFLGSITKSAQIPVSAWLPLAMAAPTPVSALVHSSTLVTAGVFVLIRHNYLFSGLFPGFFSFFFVMTMLLAGMGAMVENDYKKVVAMSTLSQLGLMLFVLSVGCWHLAYLHVIVHAFFKSMLFLSTGAMIIQMEGAQDSRFYGGAAFSYGAILNFFVSVVCLCGFPFFLGFYSKDAILVCSSFVSGTLLYFFFMIGCCVSVSYSMRLLFLGYQCMYKYSSYMHFSEKPFFFLATQILFLKSWFLGGVLYWFFLCTTSLFLNFFDLFMGLFVILAGFVVYWGFPYFYFKSFFMLSTFFLRWKSSSGYSFFFGKSVFFKFESTWLEIFGGEGVYSFLFNVSKIMHSFVYLSLGVLVLFLSLSVFFWF